MRIGSGLKMGKGRALASLAAVAALVMTYASVKMPRISSAVPSDIDRDGIEEIILVQQSISDRLRGNIFPFLPNQLTVKVLRREGTKSQPLPAHLVSEGEYSVDINGKPYTFMLPKQ